MLLSITNVHKYCMITFLNRQMTSFSGKRKDPVDQRAKETYQQTAQCEVARTTVYSYDNTQLSDVDSCTETLAGV